MFIEDWGKISLLKNYFCEEFLQIKSDFVYFTDQCSLTNVKQVRLPTIFIVQSTQICAYLMNM